MTSCITDGKVSQMVGSMDMEGCMTRRQLDTAHCKMQRAVSDCLRVGQPSIDLDAFVCTSKLKRYRDIWDIEMVFWGSQLDQLAFKCR